MSPLPPRRCRRFIDSAILAENARAWQRFAGVPVYAVVKADGYGWGCGTLVRALAGVVEGYCVADLAELRELRTHTAAPAIVLGRVPEEALAEVLDAGARASIKTSGELETVLAWAAAHDRQAVVRVGIQNAAAWDGLSSKELAALADRLRGTGASAEVWTHISDLDTIDPQVRAVDEAIRIFAARDVRASVADLASTLPLVRGLKRGNAVRIGAGLFGTGADAVPGIRCALNFSAPVVRVQRHSAGTRVGYGDTMLEMETPVATLRCGYADGLPSSLQGRRAFSIGMQYSAVAAAGLETGDEFVWLDGNKSLDAFARDAGRPVHEVVTVLGNCARAALVHREV